MLEKDERVVRVTRRHPLIILSKLAAFGVFAILPLLLPQAIAAAVPGRDVLGELFPMVDAHYAQFLLGCWWLLALMGAFRALTEYYLDVWVITNRRVIDIEQHSFFNRQVSSVFLSHVQDATTTINGILPTLLNYGDIEIQSAGTISHFRIKGVPHPRALRDIILSKASEYVELHHTAE